MTQIETDFLEFLAEKNEEPIADVRKRYDAAKAYMNFGSKEYSHLSHVNYQVLQPYFNDQSEKALFASYRYYAYPDLLRMLSYSFPKEATAKGYFAVLMKAVRKGDLNKITSFITRKTSKLPAQLKLPKAEELVNDYDAPTILDYGCGIAILSFDMAKKAPLSTVILMDLDTIKLDFAEFRFKKHGLKCTVIRIKEDNQYPELPPHTICVATDVLEHLRDPLRAYAHIRDSMETGGTLYGNFEDHHHEMYHVHADMSDVREAVSKDYDHPGGWIYKKR